MEKEKCVMCGNDTTYDKSTDIDSRMYYEEGVGQLCCKCAKPRTSAILNSRYEKTIMGLDVVIVDYADIVKRSNNFELGSFVRHLYDSQHEK